MRQFFRILRLSWHYRGRLLASVFCAIMVGIFWSINLSAIYPVLKVLSTDKNLQQWVDEEIEYQQQELNNPERIKLLDKKKKELEALALDQSTEGEKEKWRKTKEIAKLRE